MNILITGANGQLGCSLRRLVANSAEEQHISAKKGEDIFYFSDVSERPGYPTVVLDITDLDEIRIFVRNYDIDVIVNSIFLHLMPEIDQFLAHIDILRTTTIFSNHHYTQ